MTPEEQDLLTKYLTHLNILGDDGAFAEFEEWYQMVRYAKGDGASKTVEEASELRYKDVLDAARVFNQLHGNAGSEEGQPTAFPFTSWLNGALNDHKLT